MEITRFQVYKTNKTANKIILVLVVALSVFAFWAILTILMSDKKKLFGVSIPTYLIFLMQGVLGIVITLRNFKIEKYFVSWDEKELSYHLPNNSEPINIRFTDIRKIEREPQKIRIELKTGEVKYFGFTYFYFPTRTTILEFFEGWKVKIEYGKLG